MQVGQAAEIRRSYTAEDMEEFAALSGSVTPGSVPEPLIAALFSFLLGVELPGPGTNYLKQELAFLASARPGAELTARVQITRLRPDKHLVDLWATCTAPDGTLICEGRALVKAKDVAATGSAPAP